ncbi:MAG TPA: amino acid permease [Thermoanaerobaculia bacterium]|nr:amino acid permease [Thermoanaerobaculia bacterium]
MTERRQLGLAAAISAVTGESIALGIFLTPATMAKSLGSPLLLGLVWCAMGLMTVCGALCYSELAVRYPETGGTYVYLRQGYGERMAFLFGWMSAAVLDPGLAAALAVGATSYIGTLAPLGRLGMALFPVFLLLGLAAINLLGTRLSGGVMATANFFKLAVLVAIVGWAAASGRGSLGNLLPLAARRAGSGPLFPAVAGAAVSAFFSFGGWWDVAKLGGEIREPERNLPRALTAGVLLVTATYLLVSFSFLYIVPLERVVSNTAFVAQLGSALFGGAGGRVLSVCVLVAVLSGLTALTLSAPRVYYAMARDGVFFPLFGRLHPRFGTPVWAILLQTGIALLLLGWGAFGRLLSYFIFSAVLFLGISVAALFRLERPMERWWYPAAPLLYLAGSLAIAALILVQDPWPALLGVAIVLSGELLRRLFLPRSNASGLAR